LLVGHVEQFNTAVLELDRLLHDVVHIQADRVSPHLERAKDSVILDLMIHDLDIVRRIANSPVAEVQAMRRTLASPTADYACALLEFESGMTAAVTASRVAQQKIRRIEITEQDDFITIDLLRQDLTVQRVHHAEFASEEGMVYRQSGVIEIPFFERRGEPLVLELEHFIECVADGCRPRISGEDGLEALRLATLVAEAAGVEG
jgi:predicted dehydrogenase